MSNITSEVSAANILLAEDEEHIARLVAFKLGREGYQVTIARDGEEAVKLLESKPWKLLILDVMMPRLDGYGVLKAARALESTSRVPVLLLSARGQGENVPEAQHHLKKPFDPAHLAEVVRKLVNGN